MLRASVTGGVGGVGGVVGGANSHDFSYFSGFLVSYPLSDL